MTTALKLSTPQIQALHEIYAKTIKANITTKPNTIESLWKRGLIFFDKYIKEDAIFLTEDGKKVIGVADEPEYDGVDISEDAETLQKVAASQGIALTNEDAIEAIQNELNTNMWDDPEVTAEEVQAFKAMKDNLECEAPLADGVERFQDHWAMWEKELAGFGETLKWSNTQVWDGLTAEEIREDMDTEGPVNRTERRKAQRARRNFLRMVEGKGGRNRKQIKLCGGKG